VVLGLLGNNLVRKCNTSHAILYSQNIVIYGVHSIQTIIGAGAWGVNGKFRVINSGEVQRATWLRTVHGQTEWPCKQWNRIER